MIIPTVCLVRDLSGMKMIYITGGRVICTPLTYEAYCLARISLHFSMSYSKYDKTANIGQQCGQSLVIKPLNDAAAHAAVASNHYSLGILATN